MLFRTQLKKGGFQIGDTIVGTGWTKQYPEREFADYYRAGSIKVLERADENLITECPWRGDVPDLCVYEKRRARMLSKPKSCKNYKLGKRETFPIGIVIQPVIAAGWMKSARKAGTALIKAL